MAAPLRPEPPTVLASIPRSYGAGHLVPYLLWYLQRLHLGCSLVSAADISVWLALVPPSADGGPVQFDALYGHGQERGYYNAEHLDRAQRTQRMSIGERMGFHDLFVPVLRRGKVESFLVCGPFRRSPLTALELRDNFRVLSGRDPRDDEPGFLAYARGALQATELDQQLFDATRALLRMIGSLLAGRPHDARLDLFLRRTIPLFDGAPTTGWKLAATLVDSLSAPGFRDADVGSPHGALGVSRVFTHAIAVALSPKADTSDRISEMVRARNLLSHCTTLSRRLGETVCGPLGEGGVYFLTSASTRGEGMRDTARRIVSSVEQGLGVKAHVGLSARAAGGDKLAQAYDQAVLALELALQEPKSMVAFEDRARRRLSGKQAPYRARLHELRNAVSSGGVAAARLAAASLSREMLWRTGGAVDRVRTYSESVTFDLLELVEQRSVLERRSIVALEESCIRRVAETRTAAEVDRAFGEVAAELARAVTEPSNASKSARIEAAARFIENNAQLPLRVADVARQAGFSTNYFSTLFRRHTGQRFEAYLVGQRLERARALLLSSSLPVAGIGREAGFASAVHFSAAFKRRYGAPPARYRKLRAG